MGIGDASYFAPGICCGAVPFYEMFAFGLSLSKGNMSIESGIGCLTI